MTQQDREVIHRGINEASGRTRQRLRRQDWLVGLSLVLAFIGGIGWPGVVLR